MLKLKKSHEIFSYLCLRIQTKLKALHETHIKRFLFLQKADNVVYRLRIYIGNKARIFTRAI